MDRKTIGVGSTNCRPVRESGKFTAPKICFTLSGLASGSGRRDDLPMATRGVVRIPSDSSSDETSSPDAPASGSPCDTSSPVVPESRVIPTATFGTLVIMYTSFQKLFKTWSTTKS